MALSWAKRVESAHSNRQGLSRSKRKQVLSSCEESRCQATARQIDIQVRQARGEKPRSREDMEKLIDDYVPESRLGIMCEKRSLE